MATAISRQRPALAVPDELRARALVINDRLCTEYGAPIPFFHDLDPMSELVSSFLSHRTRNVDSGRAFKQLRGAVPHLGGGQDAPTLEVQDAISPCTWPDQKAPRLQEVLRAITRQTRELTLDFLADLPVAEARAWLEDLPGVGPKTSAATLLFSRLRRPALPVDSHHHRVAIRLGLIPAKVAVGPAHALLEGQTPHRLVGPAGLRQSRVSHAPRPEGLPPPGAKMCEVRRARPLRLRPGAV